MKNQTMLFVLATVLGGCSGTTPMPAVTTVPPSPRTVSGVTTVAERRIWVVVDGLGVYRCADAGAEGAPPRAACVLAPLSSGRE